MTDRSVTALKTAFWLYLFSFIAIFDLHAQYPILTPFAVSIGAAPSFIGLMMGMYSITHLPGNLIAGWSVDRFGSRIFIMASLLLAGVILLLQSRVTDPWQLLALRSVSGFVLAFLSPACMALLARITADRVKQGKLMAGNGLVHTLAAVVSPAAGALLVARIGFELSFTVLGWLLIGTALCAFMFVRDIHTQTADGDGAASEAAEDQAQDELPLPWLIYLLPIAMACAQGILSFELPLMALKEASIMQTGLLFSVISLGSLLTLAMLFLNRYSAYMRTLWGAFFLALTFFGTALGDFLPLPVLLFLIGMAKGIIYPALNTYLIELSGGSKYGRTFSILSIAYSVGAFFGPMMAGLVRDDISPYFIAFVGLMAAVLLLPFAGRHRTDASRTRLT